MATSTTLRCSEPLLATSAITWPPTVAILDADGALLAEVDIAGPPRAGRILVGDASEPSALLDYVFGHGCHEVMLILDDGPVAGWLGTSWKGSRRRWWIDVGE